ncbi:uncharacterized protein PGTG_12844 [Puccinia graminis f. sp. tritici CRL 75-36-700-3]|uniref:Pterin-binding domain-containing protein n=1 Tax=Puccinia graminis f. sp. tritici (strain CRL 75-36-700-3 / race SCCL) TaxID=418459 RepID=E3KSH4_PUCGT|nr:uncharacterized protein PGTG_12844 [Puccinia graminis f. sp. tritici CRL 75-36-700-3]EFP87260.1 hypothetical protein PGTG_12844 [Puccinia graminis f. sp. tritici CRL 75-36-700-3]
MQSVIFVACLLASAAMGSPILDLGGLQSNPMAYNGGDGIPFNGGGYGGGFGNGGLSYSSDRASNAASHQMDSQSSSTPFGSSSSFNQQDASLSSEEHTRLQTRDVGLLGLGQSNYGNGFGNGDGFDNGFGNSGLSYSSDRASNAASHQMDSQSSSTPFGSSSSFNQQDASQSSEEHTRLQTRDVGLLGLGQSNYRNDFGNGDGFDNGFGNGGLSYSSDRASDAASHQLNSQYSSTPYGSSSSLSQQDASQSSREHTVFNSAPNNVFYH